MCVVDFGPKLELCMGWIIPDPNLKTMPKVNPKA